jgi:molybdate transport system substrate-binding protein
MKRLVGMAPPIGAALLGAASAHAQAPQVQIFAAGSLRGVVGDLAKASGADLGIEIKGEFGGSGSMRERIEKGEKPDLLMSADMGSPEKLQAQGKTVVPVIAFAKNRECVVSRKSLGVTPANLADRLLDPKVRIKTSQPIADPSGDYTWAIFDKIDALRPGAGKTLKAKGEASWPLTAQPAQGQSAQAALFTQDKIDLTITYCSGGLDKELPDLLASFPVPAALDPHPQYGVAVLSNRPEALRTALYLLSEKGQAIVARNGLIPLAELAR